MKSGRGVSTSVCPGCGQNAPTLVRGLKVTCSACSTERGVLTGIPVNLAGKPSRMTAALARIVAYAGLLLTGIAAPITWYVLDGFFRWMDWLPSSVPWITGTAMVGIGTLGAGTLMLVSRVLGARGKRAQALAHERAALALAVHRGGAVTASDVALGLGLSTAQAEALLTELARDAMRVSVDADADGVFWYHFRELQRPALRSVSARVALDEAEEAELELRAGRRGERASRTSR